MEVYVMPLNPEARMSGWNGFDGAQQGVMDLHFDNVCPLCNNGFVIGSIQNKPQAFHNLAGDGGDVCDVICIHRCPVCNGIFVTKHVVHFSGDEDDVPRSEMCQIFPRPRVVFEKHIEGLKEFSPRFYSLYTSAIEAMNQGLTDIVGNVFRIALECIVKDYAKYLVPDDASKIEGMGLANCIDCYLKDVPVEKDLADAVRTIGNGFTHYVCEFLESDIVAMQDFLDSFCMFVYHKSTAAKRASVARGYLKKGNR